MLKNHKKIGIVFLSVFALLLCFAFQGHSPTSISQADVAKSFSFSLPNGFYDKDVTISMSLGSRSMSHLRIHYTLDGSTPDASSPLYTSALSFTCTPEMQAFTVKAVVCRQNEIVGGPYTATYFVGEEAASWTNTLVVSITTDEENLFSPETGILHPATDCGPTEEDWKWFEKQNCKQRGDEWIRQAHVDMFESNGANVISQEIGLCVDGDHGSMVHYPYSLKILAGEQYDKNHPTFNYPLFHYYNTRGTDFPHFQTFNNLVFRNGGNEYNAGTKDPEQKGTMLRWNIGSRLADEAGFFVAGARPAMVFLNGDFYAVTQLQDTYNFYNTGQRLNISKDRIELYKNTERACTQYGGYEDLYYSYPDLENSPIFEHTEDFNDTVSLRDMFLYYAFEVLVNNTDYPKKNYAIWRYNGAQDPGNPYTDGKYRFFINDLDCTYDFRYDDDLWVAYFENIKEDGSLMGTLVQLEAYQTQFINTLCDLMNSGLFSPEHLEEVIKEANNDFALAASAYYSPEDESQRQRNVALLKENAFDRLRVLRSYLQETFAPASPYALSVKAPAAGVKINWSTWEMVASDGDYLGTYYGDYPLRLSFEANEYQSFSHWLVNGKRVEETEIILDASLIENDRIEVELITLPVSREGLLISEVCANGSDSWIELYNPTRETIRLSDYALSNNIPTAFALTLPDVELAPAQVFLAGIDNSGLFRLENGKSLYLINSGSHAVVDSLTVPGMAALESYGRFGESNTLRYFINPTPGVPN